MNITYISGVGNHNNLPKPRQNHPNFTHKIIVDIGASNPNGSFKVSVKTDSGKEVPFDKEWPIKQLNDDDSGFIDGNHFIRVLHKRLVEIHEYVKQMPLNLFDSAEDRKKLSGVAIFVPGITDRNNIISRMPNLRDRNKNSLENIDFAEYINDLKWKNIDLDITSKDNFKFVVTKDLGGTGLAIARLLKAKNELNEGDYITAILTGGGFGSVDIKNKGNGFIEIETCESSNYLAPNHKVKKEIKNIFNNTGGDKIQTLSQLDNINVFSKIGRQATGVKDFISEYLSVLGLENLAPLAIKAGDARIVTNNTISINKNNHPELINEFGVSDYFTRLYVEDDKVTFALDSRKLNPTIMEQARVSAVNAYAEGIAEFSINKINDMVNKIVITGPLAMGINNSIEQNPELYKAKSLSDLVMKKIDTITDSTHANLPTTNYLKHNDINAPKGHKEVKIICSQDFEIKDNTFAGEILLEEGVKFPRGNWINIPYNSI